MRSTAAASALVAAGAAWACPPTPADGQRLDAEGVQLAWVSAAPIRTGEHFSLTVRACPASLVLAKVDAVMPAHRHGMNYRPTIVALGDGRWRVDGLMLHMGGDWELRWDLSAEDGAPRTLRQAIRVP